MRALSLCTCCRHYPGTATGGTASLIRPVMSAFPERVVGSACASYFSRLARRSLALRPAHSRCHQFVARLPEGFRHFVTSMPAPEASGWSGCRAGLAPAGKRRLITAHTPCEHSRKPRRTQERTDLAATAVRSEIDSGGTTFTISAAPADTRCRATAPAFAGPPRPTSGPAARRLPRGPAGHRASGRAPARATADARKPRK